MASSKQKPGAGAAQGGSLARGRRRKDPITGIDACFNYWIAVRGGDQAGIMRVLKLPEARPATWAEGEALVMDLSHCHDEQRRDYAFISPELNGWTIIFGPLCAPANASQIEPARRQVERLSRLYGRAQAYYFGSQRDGSNWHIATEGRTVRRYSDLDPNRALGEPLPIERAHLARLGLSEAPEVLHARPKHRQPDALWNFDCDCDALAVAAVMSIDPIWRLPKKLRVQGSGLIAMTRQGAKRSLAEFG